MQIVGNKRPGQDALQLPSCFEVRTFRQYAKSSAGLGFKTHRNAVRAKTQAGLSIIHQLASSSASIGSFLETAPPPYYLIYLIGAGFGLPCSEDALVVWVGSNVCNGKYSNLVGTLTTLAIVYLGVVVSDMITFGIGVLFRRGFLSGLKKGLLKDSKTLDKASAMIQRWSKLIGLVQRFPLGFRGPLCLICGFTGVSGQKFFAGVAAGALLTIPLQCAVGYLLKDASNVYLTALALASGPNLVGHLVGPLATVTGFYWAGKDKNDNDKDSGSQQSQRSSTVPT